MKAALLLPIILLLPFTAAAEPLWRFVAGGRLLGAPAVDFRGDFYLAALDRSVSAVSSSGKPLWRASLASRPTGGPALASDGTVLIGTEAGELVGLAPSGAFRFRFKVEGGACLAPALGPGGRIYVPSSQGTIHALDYRGREQWRFRFPASIAAPASVGAEGTVYLCTRDRRLHALDPSGGKRWEVSLQGEGGSPVLGAEGTIFVSSQGLQAVSPQGFLLWSYPLPARTAVPVLDREGNLYAGTESGLLYALSPRGKLRWELDLKEPVREPAAVGADGGLFVSTAAGSLYGLNRQGRTMWSYKAQGTLASPSLSLQGILAAGSEDWILYAFRAGDGPESASLWPLARHDGPGTGHGRGPPDKEGPAALILKEKAWTEEPQVKHLALEEIHRHFAGEAYLLVPAEVLEEVLAFLLAEGVSRRSLMYGRLVDDHPEVRREACARLGELATAGAQEALLRAVEQDPDDTVRRAAIRALAEIGVDFDGTGVRRLCAALPAAGEEALTAETLQALKGLAERRPLVLESFCTHTLIRIAAGPYSRAVRSLAREVLSLCAREE